MPVHDSVRAVVDEYLRRVDDTLVVGLYLTGSVALEHFHPGTSDVDFVALLGRVPDAADLRGLHELHMLVAGNPSFDGIYLTADEIRRGPRSVPSAPQALAGVFDPAKRAGQLNPLTWLELARHGIAVRGPAVGDLDIHRDDAGLREWLLGNLRGYWAGLAAAIDAEVGALPDEAAVPGDEVAWFVLGAPRLHYTLATGDVTTKCGAGEYAAATFPEFADLARRAIAQRHGADAGFTVADARGARALIAAVIDDAGRRWARS